MQILPRLESHDGFAAFFLLHRRNSHGDTLAGNACDGGCDRKETRQKHISSAKLMLGVPLAMLNAISWDELRQALVASSASPPRAKVTFEAYAINTVNAQQRSPASPQQRSQHHQRHSFWMDQGGTKQTYCRATAALP